LRWSGPASRVRVAASWHRQAGRRARCWHGQVLADTIPRNDSDNFCAFLDTIEATVDPSLKIHVILDNGSSHSSEQTARWFADHHGEMGGRLHSETRVVVNQVELFFSILQRKVIRNGSFSSQDDPITKMITFIADYDQTARPFRWTYAADPLKAV
jgi:DDE superfamily endonuclease